MKCPECNSRVDHSNLVNSPKGEEYYVCPNCKHHLVHRMSLGKVMLWSAIGVPVMWFASHVLVAYLLGPIVGDMLILGFGAVEAIAFVVSVVVVALLMKRSMRLVRR